jgi:hypothetical protein
MTHCDHCDNELFEPVVESGEHVYCSEHCLALAHAERILAPLRAKPEPGGIKHDDGKIPYELFPADSLAAITKILAFGAKKYSPNNWRGGFKYSRIFGALMRHMWDWWAGTDNDEETGESHLAHAGCCLIFLLHFVLAGTGTDDRKENNE